MVPKVERKNAMFAMWAAALLTCRLPGVRLRTHVRTLTLRLLTLSHSLALSLLHHRHLHHARLFFFLCSENWKRQRTRLDSTSPSAFLNILSGRSRLP